jgi:hypothetical protein
MASGATRRTIPAPVAEDEGQPTGPNDDSSKARREDEDDANDEQPDDEESEHTVVLDVEA